MATTATSEAATRVTVPGAYDRVFYGGLAAAFAAAVFVGFAPTFYLRPFQTAPVTVTGLTSLSPLAYLHGFLFTAWVLLFIGQTALISARRVAVHRRVGIAGAVLAAAMVATGVQTAIAAAARGSAPPGADPLAFLVIPLGDILLFGAFVAAALWNRRDRDAHKRLMILAYVTIVVAAVARWPGVLPYGPPMFFGLSLIFLLAGVVYDRLSRGRVHPVYLWGGAVFVLWVPVRLMVSGTEAWRSIAAFLVR